MQTERTCLYVHIFIIRLRSNLHGAHWAESPNNWHKVDNFVEANLNFNVLHLN